MLVEWLSHIALAFPFQCQESASFYRFDGCDQILLVLTQSYIIACYSLKLHKMKQIKYVLTGHCVLLLTRSRKEDLQNLQNLPTTSPPPLSHLIVLLSERVLNIQQPNFWQFIFYYICRNQSYLLLFFIIIISMVQNHFVGNRLAINWSFLLLRFLKLHVAQKLRI